MGRGIRVGLATCTVCGAAHEPDARQVCARCALAVQGGETEALKARNLEYLSGRFGAFVKKDPALVTAAIERRFADHGSAAERVQTH